MEDDTRTNSEYLNDVEDRHDKEWFLDKVGHECPRKRVQQHSSNDMGDEGASDASESNDEVNEVEEELVKLYISHSRYIRPRTYKFPHGLATVPFEYALLPKARLS